MGALAVVDDGIRDFQIAVWNYEFEACGSDAENPAAAVFGAVRTYLAGHEGLVGGELDRRAHRVAVIALWRARGLTVEQISVRLGVTCRTVNRDNRILKAVYRIR